MTQITALGQRILDVVNGQLIPWISAESPFILLDAPPRIIGSNPIREQPGRKLPLQRGTGLKMRIQSWPEEDLNTNAAPYMGCVVEGEADIVTGTTTAMCRKLKIPGKRWIITAPQKTLFLAPPQTPLSSGISPTGNALLPKTPTRRSCGCNFIPMASIAISARLKTAITGRTPIISSTAWSSCPWRKISFVK